MHCFTNLLCTCGLALITFGTLLGQQEDQLYHLLRFTLLPGQEQTFINANADHDESNLGRSSQQRYTYVYSNNTVEVAIPTHELTDMENRPTKRVAELDWAPFSDWTETRNPKTMARTLTAYQEYRLRRHVDLSYISSSALQNEPVPYYSIVTYLAKPGQLEKVKEMARQHAVLMQKIGSPLSFDFYSYDLGEAVEVFEIAYPAECPDDLAERRAAHAALETEATQAWHKTLPLLADEVRTITGRYVAELSTSWRFE